MKRLFKSNSEFLVNDEECILEINPNDLSSLILELLLLVKRMITVLNIKFKDNQSFKISINDNLSPADSAIFENNAQDLSVLLNHNQCQCIISYLLRAYRDSCADVNHIHIEGFLDKKPFDLTIMYEYHQRPLTPEQAEQLMRD